MSPADQAQLTALRAEIEAVDAALIDAIAQRMALAKKIRVVKQRAGQPVLDPAREAAVVARASARAREAGLPEDEIRALYWKLMAVARRVQVG
jgi:chorismate mutase/prephenate dehydrogenase